MNNDRAIFIVGSGRSGSTIFYEALSKHPSLGWMTNYDSKFPTSKVAFLHHYVRRSVFLDSALTTNKPKNKQWSSKFDKYLIRPEEAYSKWNLLADVDFSKDGLYGIKPSEESKERILHFFDSVLKAQKKQRLIVKITGPSRIGYLASIFEDAYFIHVKRNPLAVINSTIKTDYWQSSLTEPRWDNTLPCGWEDTWSKYGKTPMSLLAMQYKAVIKNCEAESRQLAKNRYLEVDYADFVNNPKDLMMKSIEFLDLTLSSEVIDYVSKPGRYQGMDWKYKAELSPEDISLINEITKIN